MFGSVIYDKALVEERIRRAQRAILNPKKPANYFLENKDSDEDHFSSELSFSSNCVSLQVSGPDVADLSFCDLPGLIASVSSTRGSGNDIALVESLVTSYIKKPSCIILLTVACETDFENQGAHRLTKVHDPEGKRTIGVLTKPDRIPTGEEANWLPFIRNEKETLENNWYCVKQPSSNDIKRNITWMDARRRENDFFSMASPWSELDAIYQKYLRTSNLVERLSSILSDLISKRLPQIQDELEKTIIRTRSLLNELPPAPSGDPRNEISTLLHNFTSDVARHVEGVPDEDGLLQAIRPAQQRFRKTIRMTAPNFRPFEQKYENQRHLGRTTFLVNEEGEDEASESEDETSESEDESQSQSRSAKTPTQSGAMFRFGSGGGSSFDGGSIGGGGGVGGGRKRKRPTNKIYIDEVMERAHRACTRELPGNYPFVVQKTFIERIIKEWHTPAISLCKTVHTTISEHIKKLVHKHFYGFGQGHLEQRVKTIIQTHINESVERAEAKVTWLLAVEDRPFSLNTHYLSDYKSKFLAHYKGSREKYERSDLSSIIDEYVPDVSLGGKTSAQLQPTGIAKILAGLAEIGMHGIKPEDLPKLLPPDRMEPALTIMADVRAYFQVAYKRFTDNVPLAIDHELIQGVERGLLRALYSNLGVNGTEGHRICRELAQESPQICDKRADLQKKLERLEIASRELLHIGV